MFSHTSKIGTKKNNPPQKYQKQNKNKTAEFNSEMSSKCYLKPLYCFCPGGRAGSLADLSPVFPEKSDLRRGPSLEVFILRRNQRTEENSTEKEGSASEPHQVHSTVGTPRSCAACAQESSQGASLHFTCSLT